MKTSKYAPRTPAESLAQSRAEKLRKQKENGTRLLGRLHWKAELLLLSYYKALEIVRAAEAQGIAQAGLDATSKQAEAMFKVDFFEFHTLLERYITTCLAVFAITVSGSAPQTNVNALRYLTNPDLQRTRPVASHAFHANLLEALDDETCPLHASFGGQDVRVQLGIAKDFRNAWKDADERVIASKWDDDKDGARKNITLHDSQLREMLQALVMGCEHAHAVLQAYTLPASSNGVTSCDFQPQTDGHTNGHSDDTPFEYMDDAMELD
ncbi:hypothetical protein EK21DRAFT_88515 [Setomelanomma holmii]|uniref:Uncharacterized protein n=1 Tax=Setomelanomma holmii TaxID=210430 RepID=A0A9P4HB59_9PLEO|nr:hypothetical protein EK21DRAFT_88515 [Setomelanomma holmii]